MEVYFYFHTLLFQQIFNVISIIVNLLDRGCWVFNSSSLLLFTIKSTNSLTAPFPPFLEHTYLQTFFTESIASLGHAGKLPFPKQIYLLYHHQYMLLRV